MGLYVLLGLFIGIVYYAVMNCDSSSGVEAFICSVIAIVVFGTGAYYTGLMTYLGIIDDHATVGFVVWWGFLTIGLGFLPIWRVCAGISATWNYLTSN